MERKYMMYEGEDGNSIDPLYETETTEPNGVKVIVPLKSGDRSSFVNKIQEQLAYFESVYFDCDGYISNTYNINRSEHFQYSDLSRDNDMHLCLDNVYYPVDFVKLGIDRINVPVGLRFSLKDGIYPIPNREALRYTPEAKQTILNKIALVADYFIDKYNSQIVNVTNLNSIFDYYDSKKREMQLGSKMYDIITLMPFATKKISTPVYSGMKYVDLKAVHKYKDSLMNEYTIKYSCRNSKMSEVTDTIKPKDINGFQYYLFTDKVAGNKREYIKSTLPSNTTFYFVKKTRNFVLGNRHSTSPNSYHVLLGLDKQPKHLWRKIIQEFQTLQQIYISQLKDYDAINIPKSWIDDRKKKYARPGTGRRTKLKGQIFGKICAPLERYVNNKSSKLIPITLDLEHLHKYQGVTVYTSYDEADLLDPLYAITKRFNNHKSSIRYVAFSDREMKLVKTLEIHNLISYNKFMEGTNMPFKRLITAYLIEQLMDEHKYVFNSSTHLEGVSTELHDKVVKLRQYRYDFYNNANNSIFQAMLTVAEENKLFDMSIYPLYIEIKDTLTKLSFIDPIIKQSAVNGYSSYRSTTFTKEETKAILVDLFKYHKYKVNLDNYKPVQVVDVQPVKDDLILDDETEDEPLSEDQEDEVLTSELLEELQEQAV